MNLFDKIFKRNVDIPLEQESKAFDISQLGNMFSADGIKTIASDQAYRTSVDVYASVNIITSACAGVPWRLTTDTGDIREDNTTDHALLKLLKRPNPRQGRSQFIEALIANHELYGDAYILRVGGTDLRRPPIELYILPSNQVSTENDGIQITKYIYTTSSKSFVYKPEEILHITSFNPSDPWHGLSSAVPANSAINLAIEAKMFNTSLFANGGKIPFVINSKTKMTPEAFERLKTAIVAQYTGTHNAGKPMLLEGDMSLTNIGLSPDDLSWMEGLKLSTKDIAKAFGIPSILIGDSEASTYSNYSEARKSLYQEKILPKLDYLRDELNNWLVPLYNEPLYLDYDSNEIEALQEDRDALYKRVTEAYQKGLLTLNEARAQLSLPADDNGGDEYFIQATSTPDSNKSINTHVTETKDMQHKRLPAMTPQELSMKNIMSGFLATQLDEGLDRIRED